MRLENSEQEITNSTIQESEPFQMAASDAWAKNVSNLAGTPDIRSNAPLPTLLIEDTKQSSCIVLPGRENLFSRSFSFSEEGRKQFSGLDKDADGAISKEELNLALNRYLSDKEKVTAELMLKHFDGLCDLKEDGIQGLSRQDINEYDAVSKSVDSGRAATEYFKHWEAFDSVDRNGDNCLSENELRVAQAHAVGQQSNRSDSLNYLLEHYEVIKNTFNDQLGAESNGISMPDIGHYANTLSNSAAARLVDEIRTNAVAEEPEYRIRPMWMQKGN